MRAPQEPQGYIERALAIIKPPAEQREAMRSRLDGYLERLSHILPEPVARIVLEDLGAKYSPSGETPKRLRRFAKCLAAMRDACPRWANQELIRALDAQIDQVQQELSSRRGHKPRDHIAVHAVLYAAGCLTAERLTLTGGGDWHLLSMLLYEARTGEPDRDHVLNYMRKMKLRRRHGLISAPTARIF
jgi:hypothetical protein